MGFSTFLIPSPDSPAKKEGCTLVESKLSKLCNDKSTYVTESLLRNFLITGWMPLAAGPRSNLIDVIRHAHLATHLVHRCRERE